jgi:hypothetical protein
MAVSQLPQAPYRQDRKIFPTPIIGDVLFSEVRDGNRTNLPEYGTPHPNTAKWPHHKLVFIKPVDIERNEIFEFFYAADREEQDRYNFSFGYRNIIGNAGGRELRVVIRTYLTPRSSFDPAFPAFKTPMPDVPEGTFDGVNYVFFDKKQVKSEPEFDSLYVIEERTYVEDEFLKTKISYSTQKPDLIPDKFRESIPNVTTEEIKEGYATLPVLTGNDLASSQDQLNPNVKVVKTTSRTQPELPVVLPEGELIVNDYGGVVAKRKESLVEDGAHADSGFGVLESSVTTLGNGLSVKTTIEAPKDADGNPLFPTVYGAQIDSRYGVPLGFSSTVIQSNSESGGLYYGTDGSFGSVDIQPKDQWHSVRNTTYLPALPAPQVWYGLRRENLPEVLLDVTIVGTERYVAVPTWGRVPDGPLKSKTTRSFTHGPPADFDPANTRIAYASESFQAVVEHIAESESTNESTSTGTSSGTSNNNSTSSSSGTSSSNTSSSSSSTSSGTATSSGTTTTSGTTSSSGTSSQSGTSSSSGTSSQSGTSSSSGTSSQSGTSSSSGTSSQSGTSSSSGTSSQSGTSSSSGTNSNQTTSSSIGNSYSAATSTGNGETRDQIQTNKSGGYVWNSTPAVSRKVTLGSKTENSYVNGYNTSTQSGTSSGSSSQNGSSSSNGSSSQNGSSSSSGSSSQNGSSSSSGSSSQNGSSSSSGSSSQNGSSSSSGSSSQSGSSSSSGTSTNSGSNSSTNSSSGTSSTTSSTSSTSTSSSANSSTSTSSSTNTSTSKTTGKSIFTLSIPKCLREQIDISLPSGQAIRIPATTPTSLSGWVAVSRQSEHWKHGIWVTELIEVFV